MLPPPKTNGPKHGSFRMLLGKYLKQKNTLHQSWSDQTRGKQPAYDSNNFDTCFCPKTCGLPSEDDHHLVLGCSGMLLTGFHQTVPKWPCGEDISNVTSVGRHARAAYEATIEVYPSLKDSVRVVHVARPNHRPLLQRGKPRLSVMNGYLSAASKLVLRYARTHTDSHLFP